MVTKYFNQELVCRSFENLSSRGMAGKTHMERTSALMYFLSVDAALKYFNATMLDLNPDNLNGVNSRKQVELEFTKLVLVGDTASGLGQVTELGKVEWGGTSPEKRISSNFFTVPMKKASNQSAPFYYPSRPTNSALLKMGQAATGKHWGICFHDNWKPNFLRILATAKSSTPSLDFAVFVCRDSLIDNGELNLFTALGKQLTKRFTKNLSDYWIARIEKEKVLARDVEAPFAAKYSQFTTSYTHPRSTTKKYDLMKKSELIKRIYHLESIMKNVP
jgi:hypothetical protein